MLPPLPQTRSFRTGSCARSLTRDFFLRDRSYACAIDTATAPEPDLGRAAYIIDHSTETLIADRVRANDGTLTMTNRPFMLSDRDTVPACEPVCKTRARKVNTAAAPAGDALQPRPRHTVARSFGARGVRCASPPKYRPRDAH